MAGVRFWRRPPAKRRRRQRPPARPTNAVLLLAAVLLIWVGLVLGVSFLATPAKYLAPGLELTVALEVGRKVLSALVRVELLLVVTSLVLALFARPPLLGWLLLALVWLIVLAQAYGLLPVLMTQSADALVDELPSPAPWHQLYLALEGTKLLALLVAAWAVQAPEAPPQRS